MNYHTLADFRVDHHDWLNSLLTDTVAVLLHQDLVTLHQVAQDGMKVRASAGADTFRRQPTLESCLAPHANKSRHCPVKPTRATRLSRTASAPLNSEPPARRPNASRRLWIRFRRCGPPAKRSRREQAIEPAPAQPTPRPES